MLPRQKSAPPRPKRRLGMRDFVRTATATAAAACDGEKRVLRELDGIIIITIKTNLGKTF